MASLPPPPPVDDTDLPVFSVRDHSFEVEVTSAILRSLEIDQILYVVLSGVTSAEGLRFNRALFMLADDGERALRTSMAIGPAHGEEAHRIWEDIKAKDLTLGALLFYYDKVKNDPAAHALTRRLAHISLPFSEVASEAAKSPGPDEACVAPIRGMLARCLLERRLIRSTTLELACDPELNGQEFRFSNWCMVPLLTPDHVVGMLVADNAFSERVMTLREEHLLVALANLSAIAVEKSRLFAKMRALAEVDGLTGIANRRAYEEAATRLLREARQTGRSVSLVLVDIDFFKQCNDLHGHLVGDDVLRDVAALLAAHARKGDVVARYGGEEFAVLLPDAGLEQGKIVGHKLLDAVREAKLAGGVVGRLTVSAGVAVSRAGDLDGMALFEAADRALYEAKRAGRDRVVCAE